MSFVGFYSTRSRTRSIAFAVAVGAIVTVRIVLMGRE